MTRPRTAQLGVLASLRNVRKREAKARLEQLASQVQETSQVVTAASVTMLERGMHRIARDIHG